MRLYQPVRETNDDDDDGTSMLYPVHSGFLQWPIGSSRADVLKTLAEGIFKDEAAWFEWPQTGGASRLADLHSYPPWDVRSMYSVAVVIPQQHT